jgi:DNA-binding transcriptional LysR family regulator
MGDSNAALERFRDPDPQLDLGLWLLYHPDLRHTRRVVAFREHMLKQMQAQFPLFEGRLPRVADRPLAG